MAAWKQAVATVAALAVSGGLAYGVYLTVDGALLAEPVASTSASASPSASATIDPCDWDALPAEARPALAEQAEGLPEAFELSPDMWACTGPEWTVEINRVESESGWPFGGTAQAIYLRSPSGDLVHLYDLRTDVQVEVVGEDVPAKVVWTARVTGGDSFQVVQMDLADGVVAEDWGGGVVPDSQRRDGAVWDVRAIRDLERGGELWLGYNYLGQVTAVFQRVEGRTFQTYSGQQAIDSLIDHGSVDGAGQPGVTMWISEDTTAALALAQQPAAPGGDVDATTGAATWVVLDLDRDLSRLASSTIPERLCAPAADATLAGSYDAPEPVRAECPQGSGDWWLLPTDGNAVPDK